jgi:hypothetical protein
MYGKSVIISSNLKGVFYKEKHYTITACETQAIIFHFAINIQVFPTATISNINFL